MAEWTGIVSLMQLPNRLHNQVSGCSTEVEPVVTSVIKLVANILLFDMLSVCTYHVAFYAC